MKLSALKATRDYSPRWVKDVPGMGDIELLVRPTGNPEYRRKMQALFRALPPSKKAKGNIDPVEQDRITAICLNECSLSDWKNVEGDDGKTIPYSKELATEYLQFPAFRDGVLIAAASLDDEDAESNEQIEKNSAAPSDTP